MMHRYFSAANLFRLFSASESAAVAEASDDSTSGLTSESGTVPDEEHTESPTKQLQVIRTVEDIGALVVYIDGAIRDA